MTEAEWLACADPLDMVGAVGKSLSDRQLRLFLIACCQRILHFLEDRRSLDAVEVGGRLSDGLCGQEQLAQAAAAAQEAFESLRRQRDSVSPWLAPAAAAAAMACSELGYLGSPIHSFAGRYRNWSYAVMQGIDAAAQAVAYRAIREANGTQPTSVALCLADERIAQCHLLRDIAGSPFRPIRISPAVLAWNDSLVVRLAQAVYDERRLPAGTLESSRLAVLADALEEAGCSDQDMLGHLRGPGPHVRGCWAVDLLLGKE